MQLFGLVEHEFCTRQHFLLRHFTDVTLLAVSIPQFNQPLSRERYQYLSNVNDRAPIELQMLTNESQIYQQSYAVFEAYVSEHLRKVVNVGCSELLCGGALELQVILGHVRRGCQHAV